MIAQQIGTPEVIYPDDVRNDLYITLLSGEFSRGDKNIEVSVSVCSNGAGEVLEVR